MKIRHIAKELRNRLAELLDGEVCDHHANVCVCGYTRAIQDFDDWEEFRKKQDAASAKRKANA